MVKLESENIYLATLERKDCEKLWNDFEYDFDKLTEPLNIGHSIEKAGDWFDEIKKEQGERIYKIRYF